MAKPKKDEEEDEKEKPEEKAKGGKKKLIIIIAAVVLVVGGGVGALFAFKGSKGNKEGGEATAEGGAGKAEEGGAAGAEGEAAELPGAVFPLETFIVNLGVKGSFLKTQIQLEFATPELPANTENNVPKIRDAVIRILSSKNSADILSVDGKEKLREEIKNGVNEAIGAEDVVNVYFTEFIVQ